MAISNSYVCLPKGNYYGLTLVQFYSFSMSDGSKHIIPNTEQIFPLESTIRINHFNDDYGPTGLKYRVHRFFMSYVFFAAKLSTQ